MDLYYKGEEILGKNDIEGRIINPNLLINWYFANPVNRKGATKYTVGYGLDMWQLSNATITLQDHSTTITFNGTGVCIQIIKGGNDLVGKQLTLSALTEDNELVSGSAIIPINESYVGNIFSKDKRWYLDIKYRSSDNSAIFRFVGASSANNPSVSIIAAKLELGSVQTLAHQENGKWVLNEIPNYAEQYAICSQYSPITGEFVGSQHSNQNLLDNWYFLNPINQKGEKTYSSTSNTYCFDRWLTFGASSVEILNNGVKINGTIDQLLAVDVCQVIYGKETTVSVLYSDGELVSSTGTPGANITGYCRGNKDDGTSNFNIYGGWNASTNRYIYQFLITGTPNCTVVAAKVELGPVQTLAHRENGEWVLNDQPPNYQQELAKCQWYQVVFTGNANMIATGIASGPREAYMMIPVPVPMRGQPTVSYKDLYITSRNHFVANSIPVINIGSIRNAGTNINISVSTEKDELISGDFVMLQIRSNDGYFILDANL